MTYESTIWHTSRELKESNSIASKLIVIQNRCLRTVIEVYRVIFVAVLETETHILLIAIHLNRLQRNTRRRLKQESHHIKKLCKTIENKLREVRERRRIETFTSEARKSKWAISATNSVKKTLILTSLWRDLIEKQRASMKKIAATNKAHIKVTSDLQNKEWQRIWIRYKQTLIRALILT